MRRLFLFALLLVSSLACGQGTATFQRIVITDSLGRPLGGVSAEICNTTPSQNPTCVSPATIYANQLLTTPISCTGPTSCLTTDALGQIPIFFATPGYYCYVATAAYITDTSCHLIALFGNTTPGLGIDVSSFPGVDTCAKIQAADDSLGAATGTLNVPLSLANGACATPPLLAKGHTINFLDTATYNLALTCSDSTTDLSGSCYIACPSGATLKLPNGANRDIITNQHFSTLTGTNNIYGITASIRGCQFDVNAANNTSGYAIRMYGPRLTIDSNKVTNGPQGGMWVEGTFSDAVPNYQSFITNNSVSNVAGVAYTAASNDSFWANNSSFKSIGSGSSWGIEITKSAIISGFDAFENVGGVGTTGGCHIGALGSVIGSSMECTNDSGFGLLIDTGSGNNQITGTFACNGCTAISEAGTSDIISGALVNSTIGFKGTGGGGIYHFAGGKNTTVVDCTSINGEVDFTYYSADGTEFPYASNCGTNIAVNNTGLVRSGNVVTMTTDSSHGFRVGDKIVSAGALNSSFNGTFIVATVPSLTALTYAQTAADASSGQGTVKDLNFPPQAGTWHVYIPGGANAGVVAAIPGDTLTVGGFRHRVANNNNTLAALDDVSQIWSMNQNFANETCIQWKASGGSIGCFVQTNNLNNFTVGDVNDVLGTTAMRLYWHGAIGAQFAASAFQLSLPLWWATDGLADIGQAADHRPNNIYAKTAVTAPTGSFGALSGAAVNASAGKAVCWKTATTLGFCSTVVDAGGACTCN